MGGQGCFNRKIPLRWKNHLLLWKQNQQQNGWKAQKKKGQTWMFHQETMQNHHQITESSSNQPQTQELMDMKDEAYKPLSFHNYTFSWEACKLISYHKTTST